MSSNLNYGGHGFSHQTPSPYFQNNAFANFDPALSNNNDNNGDGGGGGGAAGTTGGGTGGEGPSPGQQPWSYHLGLAQLQNHQNNNHGQDAAFYHEQQQQQQHPGWHNALSSNAFRTNNQGEFHSDIYGASLSTAASHASTFRTAAFDSPHPDPRQFEQSFSRSDASQEAPYNVQRSVPYSGYQTTRSPEVDRDTIAPQDLQQKHQPQSSDSESRVDNQLDPHIQGALPAQHMHSRLPPGTASGNFLITSVEALEGVSNSRLLHKFVHIGTAAQNVTVSKSTIPTYVPRKTRNEIMKLLASDSNLKAKVNKKVARKSPIGVSKGKSGRIIVPTTVNKAIPITKQPALEPSSEEESADDDSASSSSEEESIQPPLPATRPTRAIEAVKYDTIKALWRVPYRSALGDDIRKGLADFWEVTKTIRDRWKSDVTAVKQAEETKKVNELPLLKERVANQRDMLEAALRAAITDGHKDIIEHLGENLPLMNALAVSLQDRARDADYNGGLSKSILEILSLCKTITEGNLDKTGIAKILPRFGKRGDESVKALTQKITDNTAAASKKRKEANRATLSAASQSKSAKVIPAAAAIPRSPVAGAKRPRENETRNIQPTKKIASNSASGVVSQSESPIRKTSVSDGKTPVPTITAKKVVTKPTNFFSSLQPAYKKPVTPVAGGLASQIKPPISGSALEKRTAQASAAAATPGATFQSKPAFSFAETMANLTKPKEAEPAPKREDSTVEESPEEKAKRLRKEQRRSLRVSFKPDNELVETRFFVHDPDEEEGHDASQVRDVGDLESEGRMFKLQHQGNQERMQLEEDEEDDNEKDELASKEYLSPSLIDFSDIPEEDRNRNYIPYGGGAVEPESLETAAQRQREEDTLLVVYTQRSDIPSSPKEATEPVQEATSPKEFGAPPQDKVLSRLSSDQEVSKTSSQGPLPLSSTDLTALIGSLTQQSFQPQPPLQSTPQLTELEKIVAQISSQNQPPQQQQQQSQAFNPQQYQNMQNAYSSPNPYPQNSYPQNTSGQQTVGAVDVSALLASLQGQVPSTTPDVSSLLGSLPQFSQQQRQQQSQGYPQPPQQQQQPQQQQYPFENEERRRFRESGGIDTEQQRAWQAKKPPRDPNRPTPKFILPCKYFKEGKCSKGLNCTYRHDID